MTLLSAAEAAELIRAEQAPARLMVTGHLDLAGAAIRSLPPGLTVESLDLSGCRQLTALPGDLAVRKRLVLDGCAQLAALPAGLSCYELSLAGTAVQTLPADIQVAFRLDLSDCHRLRALPAGLAVPSLILRNCTSLSALPEGLDVYYLDISGCMRLTGWPRAATLTAGRFRARDCLQLTRLPPWVRTVSELDVGGCQHLAVLPAGLQVSSWLDIGQTAVQTLPLGCWRAELRWNGVRIEPRIAFQPQTITVDEILYQDNVELRRVLIERVGYERFFREAGAKLLDQDTDPGGARHLLHVPIPNDEDLLCLRVLCPSTGRAYLIRVPPHMESCPQAAAWIAGFDNPDDYRPLVET